MKSLIKRKNFMASWQEIRIQILQRDGYKCQSCGKRTSGQVHHIIPRSKGGSNELSNLMVLCGKCHMLVSPVPNWVIAKVWRILSKDIAKERQYVFENIRRWQLGKGNS